MEVPEFPPLLLASIPVFLLAMVAEIGIGRWSGWARYESRDTLASLAMGAGNLVEGLLVGGALYAVLWWIHDHFALFSWSWSWPMVALALVVDDLRYYWFHRCAHEVRWYWAAHVNHHSSQHFNLSTALRQSWGTTLALVIVFKVPLVLLGIHPAVLIFSSGVSRIYQFGIHTELVGRLPGWVEAVFNTPSHHRVHHATNPRYLDANYGGILIVWDRLFGTFVPERADDPCRYGLVRNLGTFHPVRIAFHEWADMARDVTRPGLGWRARLAYLAGPPGWSHDGRRVTTAGIKAAFLRRHPERQGEAGLTS